MQEYSFLELDYKNCALEKEVDFWKKQLENPVSWMKKIDQDTFLCQFSEDSKKALAAFICDCDRIAHLSKGEFSLSIHPDTNEASAVILARKFICNSPGARFFPIYPLGQSIST